MDFRKVKTWITVNGNHIPIYEGESKQDAVNRLVANQNENRKVSQITKNKKIADSLNGKSVSPMKIEDSIYSLKTDAKGNRMSHAQQIERFEKELNATPSQIEALQDYTRGFYSDEPGGKENFARVYNLEELLEANEHLQLADAKLFRGGYVDDAEYKALTEGKSTTMLDGLTSWSLREDVAHMYAQGDPYTGEVFGGREAKGGHRVVFVESDTNDSLPLPYTDTDETIRGRRKYKIVKVVPESEYKGKESDYMGTEKWHTGFDEPVTYIYVKSQK